MKIKEGNYYKIVYRGIFCKKVIYGYLKKINLEEGYLEIDRGYDFRSRVYGKDIIKITEVEDKGEEFFKFLEKEK
jgi:hypothetical protein